MYAIRNARAEHLGSGVNTNPDTGEQSLSTSSTA